MGQPGHAGSEDGQQVGETPTGVQAAKQKWLVLVYRVPSDPTRLRATVWRRLRSLGAVYLQNSVATLPAGSTGERAMRKLRHEIIEMGGTAVLMESRLSWARPTSCPPSRPRATTSTRRSSTAAAISSPRWRRNTWPSTSHSPSWKRT